MADDTSGRGGRRPLSLNDRHYRLLQDLSAPPKQPPSSSHGEDVGGKPSMVKLAGRRRLCKASAKQDVAVDDGLADPDFDLLDFDSPVKAATKPKRAEGGSKFPSRDEAKDANTVVTGEPNFSLITDFGSVSPQPRCKEERQGGGGQNEIRDILDDLTSKLGSMSIQKKKDTQSNDLDEGGVKCHLDDFESTKSSFSLISDISDSSSDLVGKRVAKVDNLEDELSRRSCALHETKATKDFEGEGEENSWRLSRHIPSSRQPCRSNSEDDGHDIGPAPADLHKEFASGISQNQEVGRSLKTSRYTDMNEKLRSVGSSNVSKLRELDEDDDDCVVLTGPKVAEVTSRVEKPKKPARSIDIDTHYYLDGVVEDEGSITLNGLKSSYILPGKIATMLYPHQREGLKWLWSLHTQGKGGILGDDMGLGKTMQICSFLSGLFHSKLIKRALIVAPKTLLPHWIKELTAVGLSRMTREYYGNSAKARDYELRYILEDKGVLLTTYDIVRNNSKALQGDNHFSDDEDEDEITWDYMILDEGHLIKNPSTQRAKSLLEIPSSHRIIISGTPIQNNLKELWALFNFCCPGLLGDKNWFKENYEHYILRGNDKNASDREKRIGSTIAKNLRDHIQPFFLRRLKSEVFGENDDTAAKLSKKNELVIWLRLTNCQRQLYEAFLKSEIVYSAFDGSPLAALTILKKICDHPLLLTKRAAEDVLEGMESTLTQEEAGVAERLAMHIADNIDTDDFQAKHDSVSCKISFIMSLLSKLIPEGHHVLIFSQTRKMLNLIQESLTSNRYKFLRIDGTTKSADRLKIVNDFQEGNGAPIFLLTSQVGGLGLTLTKADRVIVVDPAWNPSTDNQSVDRAYRIGQKKDVIVYRLMTSGTVEEKIYRKQVYKGGLFKTATEHKEQIRYFSQQDLRELFSLPKEGFDVSPTQQQLHEEHYNQIKMDEALESHVKFLETLGIAGVSHHSLLFSKTAPVQVIQEEVEEIRRGTSFAGRPTSSYSQENMLNGAEYAFNPKDVNLSQKINISPIDSSEMTESEIKARINRLSLIFANKNTISKLPDRGAKLQKQIAELNQELESIEAAKSMETPQVIELDEISGKLHKGLNL
ncbi:PREDICTED: protein CHROMATIN REMODELING 24 [Tarenaya hassleriana]|uniref:protein CHROMATIN REMODELING 24 n=1 Tax=Tarenaya hassleriana TaxID=28532 RepID=UPI00053C1675|nr:PREDICTED: protein CHROMATIN REMODELING 24 [Tarenaya hassleriana]